MRHNLNFQNKFRDQGFVSFFRLKQVDGLNLRSLPNKGCLEPLKPPDHKPD